MTRALPSSALWPPPPAPCTHPEPRGLCEHRCWHGSSGPQPWGEAVYFWFPNNSCFQELPANGRGRVAVTEGHVQGQPREEAEVWPQAVAPRAGRGTSAAPLLCPTFTSSLSRTPLF